VDIAYIATLIGFGLTMGLVGGLLGIGGAVVLIPALTFAFGENQHLYQAASMICIFFVSASALIAHRKADIISRPVLIRMVPMAIVGIIAGVAMSNCALFEGKQDYLLSRLFGGFLVYVAVYNSIRLYQKSQRKKTDSDADSSDYDCNCKCKPHTVVTCLVGLFNGFASGLLGIGAGTVATPLQQLFLKMPIRRAMSNSAALIVSISWLGAAYKNATLSEHGITISQSLEIAVWVIPGAIIGGYVGGHLMHKLPQTIVRIAFIIVCGIAAAKLLTVTPS
jgi:uncharacterized membrane protein YfcA